MSSARWSRYVGFTLEGCLFFFTFSLALARFITGFHLRCKIAFGCVFGFAVYKLINSNEVKRSSLSLTYVLSVKSYYHLLGEIIRSPTEFKCSYQYWWLPANIYYVFLLP